MKNSFSLLELIIAVLIISIITAFIASKYTNLFNSANITKLKANVSLIRNGITKLKQEKVLLQDYSLISSLDDEPVQTKTKLFSNVLSNPINSTTTLLKESGKWFKQTNILYGYYISKDKSIYFEFKDLNFYCKKPKDLCEELF